MFFSLCVTYSKMSKRMRNKPLLRGKRTQSSQKNDFVIFPAGESSLMLKCDSPGLTLPGLRKKLRSTVVLHLSVSLRTLLTGGVGMRYIFLLFPGSPRGTYAFQVLVLLQSEFFRLQEILSLQSAAHYYLSMSIRFCSYTRTYKFAQHSLLAKHI